MSNMTMYVLGFAGLLVIILIAIYNRLVSLRLRANEAWSQIDVQLKRRNDLVPNLVETVKGYAAHEKSVFENVANARAAMQGAGSDPALAAQANNQLAGALKSLFAVVENYPELKANENFKMLQTELAGIEDRIAYARQFYNESVRMYNEYQQQFPGSVFAGMFGHKSSAYFEATEAEKAAPQVKF
jgi:LemA protein